MSIVNNSDKTVINFEESIQKLKPVTWIYNGDVDNIRHIGYIAEEVYEVDDLKYLVVLDDEDKPLALKYDLISIYTVEVIKILSKKIDALEARVKELEDKQ